MWPSSPRTRLGSRYSEGARLLRIALKQRGWSQTRLKTELGTALSVSYWIFGDKRPSLEWAIKLRDLLGIPVEAWRQPANDVIDAPALAATGTEG